MRARAIAADLGAKRLIAGKDNVTVEFETARLLTRSARNVLTQQFGPRLQAAWQNQPALTYRLDGESAEEAIQVAQRILKALAEV